MKKGLTEMVFILDRSGSMYGLEADTIGGFNSMIEKQKKEPGEAKVTTILFNQVCTVIHDRFALDEISPMDEKIYETGGSTALLDAVGSAIQKEVSVQRHLPEEARAEKVIFVIITDGYENSSVEYSYKDVKKMIEHEQKKYGWEFLFLGANIDAVSEGAKFGIRADRAVRYKSDSAGTQLNYQVVGEALSTMRSMDDTIELAADWMDAINKDVKARGL